MLFYFAAAVWMLRDGLFGCSALCSQQRELKTGLTRQEEKGVCVCVCV